MSTSHSVPDGDLGLVPLHLRRGAALLHHAQQGGVPPRLLVHASPADAQARVRPADDGEDRPHLRAERPQVVLRQLSQAVLLPPVASPLLLRPRGRLLAFSLGVVLLAAFMMYMNSF